MKKDKGGQGQNKTFVLDAGGQRQPVKRWEEWGHEVKAAREVNGFSRGILYRKEGVPV